MLLRVGGHRRCQNKCWCGGDRRRRGLMRVQLEGSAGMIWSRMISLARIMCRLKVTEMLGYLEQS